MSTLTIRTEELARELGCDPKLIRKYRARLTDSPLLQGLPEPISSRPVLTWHRQDIIDWLESRRTFKPSPAATTTAPEASPAPAPKRGRGRPRKLAAVAGEKGGAA